MALEAPTPDPSKQEQFMYKGRLQGYTQRSALPLPVYQTFQEGVGHPLLFRSSVVVDGETFTSPLAFSKRKEAEQYAAKFALENILSKIKDEGIPVIHNDSTLCKSILHEFTRKMKMELPKYTTTESKGLRPMFVTSVVFDGKSHQGGAGRTKKEAEQIGARTVIEWILGHSDTSVTMAEVIKSKSKLFGILHGNIPVEVPLDTVSNGNDAAIVTMDDKLPVAATGSPQEESVPTLVQKNNLEGSTSELLGTVSNGSSLEENIQIKEEVPSVDPLVLMSEEVPSVDPPVLVSEEVPSVVPPVLVSEEVPSVDPPVLLNESQGSTPAIGGKRSRNKHKRGSRSKKIKSH